MLRLEIRSDELKNGLRLACVPVSGTSFIELIFAVKTGSRNEPERLAGISHFLEHMIFRGSKSLPSSSALNHAIETVADGLEAGTARELTVFALQTLPEHLDRSLEILADLFQNPVFGEIETEKKIVYEEMLEELDEHGNESDLLNISRLLVLGDHPLARPILGRKKSLKRIKRKDLIEYFKAQYGPTNMMIVASGKITPERFFKAAKKTLGKWHSRPIKLLAQEAIVAPTPSAGPLIQFRSRPRSQIEVLLTFLGEGERSPNFVQLMALERVLDDGLASRLQRRLCDRRGLLYDIGVALDSYTDLSFMDFAFKIDEKKALIAIREILAETIELRTKLIPKDELARIKARMKREAIGLFETPRSLAARVAETNLLGMATPLEFSAWQDAIDALEPEILLETAKRLFQPEKLVVVLEGIFPPGDRTRIRNQILKTYSAA